MATAVAGLLLLRAPSKPERPAETARATLGGPFLLTDGNGKPFSSSRLSGKPYAIFFGFTRCGDVCPTTLSRLVKLRREVGTDEQLNIVFVTIDPANDGPREVGQYAQLFGAPIIGLTGSPQQIDKIKKQYGIFAEPTPHAAMGKQVAHTASILLFDRSGRFAATIAPDESAANAIAKIRQIAA